MFLPLHRMICIMHHALRPSAVGSRASCLPLQRTPLLPPILTSGDPSTETPLADKKLRLRRISLPLT